MSKTISQTTPRPIQRRIFKTIFRLARSAFLRFRCYYNTKIKLQCYIVVDDVIHISKLKGVAQNDEQNKLSRTNIQTAVTNMTKQRRL